VFSERYNSPRAPWRTLRRDNLIRAKFAPRWQAHFFFSSASQLTISVTFLVAPIAS
jgi:hypothetical protein